MAKLFEKLVKLIKEKFRETIKPRETVNNAYYTITIEAGSKLNLNCEPSVSTGSLEQASTSSTSSQSDCDVKPFDPKEFHDKVCCYACGRPSHIVRHCLYRPTEFFYGKNQKVTPKAKPARKPMRTDQSSKPRVKPQKLTLNHPTTKRAKPTQQSHYGFHNQKSNVSNSKSKPQLTN
ncbi:hypothetical protein R6Q57_005624 [Mikania cordata]